MINLFLKQNGLRLDGDRIVDEGHTEQPLPVQITPEQFKAILTNPENQPYLAGLLAFLEEEARLAHIERLEIELERLPLVHFQVRTELYMQGLQEIASVNL